MRISVLVAVGLVLAAGSAAAEAFLCAQPEILGASGVDAAGGVEVSECTRIHALSLGVSTLQDDGSLGPERCAPVEIVAAIDPATPLYVRFAAERREIPALRVLIAGPQEPVLEAELVRVTVVRAMPAVEDGEAVTRLTLLPAELVVASPASGERASLVCEMPG
jgi:hypothetical protein